MNNEMEQKHIPTDEQIARFLGGTATEEEKNAVLEYMSQSDENLEEVLAIADAVQAQRASQQAAKTSSNRAVAWRIAASVAVVLIAGGVWFALRDRGTDLEPQAGNTVAMNTPATPPATTEPDTTVAPDGNSTDVAPTVTTTPTSGRNNSSNLVADAGEPKEEPLRPLQWEIPSSPERTADATIAAAQVNTGQSKTQTRRPDAEHQVRIQMPEYWIVGTDLVFSWGSTDKASGIKFSIRNANSPVVPPAKSYYNDTIRIPAAEIEPLIVTKGDLEWTLQPLFDDENLIKDTSPRKGRIKVKFSEGH